MIEKMCVFMTRAKIIDKYKYSYLPGVVTFHGRFNALPIDREVFWYTRVCGPIIIPSFSQNLKDTVVDRTDSIVVGIADNPRDTLV